MPKCFVIQGFGVKTDFESGRNLDLDASYEVIKDAVVAAGLECIRADEVQHAGVIDRPMYENLLESDLVIADVSTSNLNAAYELGVRHALRRARTIIVAEDQFKFPFDISRNAIRTYKHLGEDIGRKEATRFQTELTAAIREIMAVDDVDSPLYTFITELDPPARRTGAAAEPDRTGDGQAADDTNVAFLLAEMRNAKRSKDWLTMTVFARKLSENRPRDAYFVQQLALATYKPADDETLPVDQRIASLHAARGILASLEPDTTHDVETLGLWGAVHKRLFQLEPDVETHMDEALGALGRGFALKSDYYNGINYAFMLNVRSKASADDGQAADAITDWVIANRVRTTVVDVCESLLASGSDPHSGELLPDAEYWITATLWEACVGLGDEGNAADWERRTRELAPPQEGWMLESTVGQIAKLRALLAHSPLHRIASSD